MHGAATAMSESTPAVIIDAARLHRGMFLAARRCVRWVVALILVAGCGDREIDIRLEGEGVPFGEIDQWKDLPLGAGLSSRISVVRVQWGPRGGEPAFLTYTDDQLRFSAKGGELVPCDGGTCVTATSGKITISADTPDGASTRMWPVAADLRLSAFTPGSIRETVTALHVEVGTATELRPVFVSDSLGEVSGHADLVATGAITLESSTVFANSTGGATIYAPSLPDVPALRVRAVTRDESLVSIASFTLNRWSKTIELATEDTATWNSVVVEGFDADGALALYGLPFTARGGSLAPANATGGPCTTGDVCFLNPRLPVGVNDVMTELELRVGSTVQTVPVHITREVQSDG